MAQGHSGGEEGQRARTLAMVPGLPLCGAGSLGTVVEALAAQIFVL